MGDVDAHKVWDLPARNAQPKAGEFILHEHQDGSMECWKIKDVVFVEKGQGEFDSDKWDCTCSRVDSEEDGVRCYIISDIIYSQMEKVLANMEERGMTSPTDQQVLCVIRNMEPTNN